MKKISREILTVLLVVVLNTAACAETNSETIDAQDVKSANIKGISIKLANNSGKCQLSSRNSIVNLEIPWPCDFHRGLDNRIRIKEFNSTSIILIENSRPHPKLPNACDTRLQAVKVTYKNMHPSEYTENVSACPPFQWDEKMFIGLFEY